jgi:hypothetical protein
MISVVGIGHGGHQLLIIGDTTKDKEKAVELIKDFIEKVWFTLTINLHFGCLYIYIYIYTHTHTHTHTRAILH